MSTRKGGETSRKPKYQNEFAYHANKHSMKSQRIRKLPNCGLCQHCFDVIEWKKRYHKYKPLTTAGKCNLCHEKKIKQAYHTICDDCAEAKNICAKCCKEPISKPTLKQKEDGVKKTVELEEDLMMMRERERRAVLRKLEQAKSKGRKRGNGEENDEDDDEDGENEDGEFNDEDFGDEEEDDGDEGDHRAVSELDIDMDRMKAALALANKKLAIAKQGAKATTTTETAAAATTTKAEHHDDEEEEEEEDDGEDYDDDGAEEDDFGEEDGEY